MDTSAIYSSRQTPGELRSDNSIYQPIGRSCDRPFAFLPVSATPTLVVRRQAPWRSNRDHAERRRDVSAYRRVYDDCRDDNDDVYDCL